VLEHPQTFTALETAQAQHVPGRQMVKTVVVEADGKLLMCVLAAVQKMDFAKLKAFLGCRKVGLADEQKVALLFPDDEMGAQPPFGGEAGLPVYAEKTLEENDSVVFNAGTHQDMVRIKLKDYLELAKPTFAEFGEHL
jgi:Ala-tRNA(Pro) deacylase